MKVIRFSDISEGENVFELSISSEASMLEIIDCFKSFLLGFGFEREEIEGYFLMAKKVSELSRIPPSA